MNSYPNPSVITLQKPFSFLTLSKTNKESNLWSDITASPDGPALLADIVNLKKQNIKITYKICVYPAGYQNQLVVLPYLAWNGTSKYYYTNKNSIKKYRDIL